MTFFYLIGLPLLIVAALWAWALIPERRSGWGSQDGYGIFAFIISILAVVWLALILPIYYGSRAADRSTCRGFAHRSGRPTKFVQYNAFSWDCLTRAHDGKWISTSQIGDYNK